MTGTIANRSVTAAAVIPELAYRDVVEATDWLCRAFGFTVRIADHRAQLVYGEGAQSIADIDPADWGGTLVADDG